MNTRIAHDKTLDVYSKLISQFSEDEQVVVSRFLDFSNELEGRSMRYITFI